MIRYQCGAVEQWITPVSPEGPVDFQELSRSIVIKDIRSRLTTPVAKSIFINPFADQPGESFQRAAALKDKYREILER